MTTIVCLAFDLNNCWIGCRCSVEIPEHIQDVSCQTYSKGYQKSYWLPQTNWWEKNCALPNWGVELDVFHLL